MQVVITACITFMTIALGIKKLVAYIALQIARVNKTQIRENVSSQSEAFVACSNCFTNQGLKLDAERLGTSDSANCPKCMTTDGLKLTSDRLITLAQHFFVWGSVHKTKYGSAPVIQFNDRRETDITMPNYLCNDVALFESVLGIGFFKYGPRLWMLGEIEPLKCLQKEGSRNKVINKILQKYGLEKLRKHDQFYRVRKNPNFPSASNQYDSKPVEHSQGGRLDTPEQPVLYASPDLQTCLHECRVTAEDDLFVATLRPTRDLKLLNVATLLEEEDEFESLDLAVNMLFLAGEHSYAISRAIARAAQRAGFDGLVYPSYFSMLRNGVKPFETTYGISHRTIPQYKEFEESKISFNYAIFGRPIEDGILEVSCINRVVLSTVVYSVHFGPVLDPALVTW